MEDLEGTRPIDAACIAQLGKAHLGVVVLPSYTDSFEQMQVNNQPDVPRNWRTGEHLQHSHNEIRLLIFGGSTFKDEKDEKHDDKCYLLSILPGSGTFKLKYLPGAKLR